MAAIPDQLTQSAAELQAAYEDSVAKATVAQSQEQAAKVARQAAEDAKGAGHAAVVALQGKMTAHQQLLQSTYPLPAVPPPAA